LKRIEELVRQGSKSKVEILSWNVRVSSGSTFNHHGRYTRQFYPNLRDYPEKKTKHVFVERWAKLFFCKKEVWLFEPRAAFSGQNRALEWSTALCSGSALALGAHFDDLRRLEVGITLHGVSMGYPERWQL
jgi:hypothetical protein